MCVGVCSCVRIFDFLIICRYILVQLWCAINGHLKGTFMGHLEDVISCCFSPCGAWILSASHDR